MNLKYNSEINRIIKDKNISKYYIYKLTYPNNKVYIDQTKNIKERLYKHKCHANYNDNNKKQFCERTISKYGWENIKKADRFFWRYANE